MSNDGLSRDGLEAAIEEQRKPSAEATLQLHLAEQWRDRLIADDGALTDWLARDTEADVQHLRTLIRQARKDAQALMGRTVAAIARACASSKPGMATCTSSRLRPRASSAPTTPPRIKSSASSMSTVWLFTACITVVKPVTKMI